MFLGKEVIDDLQIPKSRTLYYGLEIGAFHHKRALNATFAQFNFGFRKQGIKGRTWSFDIGNGYFLGSIPNVYSINDGVVTKTRSINHYSMHSLNFSYGATS